MYHFYCITIACFLYLHSLTFATVPPKSKSLKWGIVGSGNIANDFVNALSVLPADEHVIVAIAAQNLSSATDFARTHNISKAYEGYLNIALDPDVEIAYIALINPFHLNITQLMLRHKKHVLCEKPMGLNRHQVSEMITTARENGRFLVEGIWSRSLPTYHELIKIIQRGDIGHVMHVNTTFELLLDVPRDRYASLGGGATLDVGTYGLQFQQLIYDSIEPLNLVASGEINEYGADLFTTIKSLYPTGQTALVYSNITVPERNIEAVIIGTKGCIRVPEFYCASNFSITFNDGSIVNYSHPFPPSDLFYNFAYSVGLSYEASEVRRCIKEGLKQSPLVPLADSLQLAGWQDSIREQIGVHFDADKIYK